MDALLNDHAPTLAKSCTTGVTRNLRARRLKMDGNDLKLVFPENCPSCPRSKQPAE
jgi:hypothetical protein